MAGQCTSSPSPSSPPKALISKNGFDFLRLRVDGCVSEDDSWHKDEVGMTATCYHSQSESTSLSPESDTGLIIPFLLQNFSELSYYCGSWRAHLRRRLFPFVHCL